MAGTGSWGDRSHMRLPQHRRTVQQWHPQPPIPSHQIRCTSRGHFERSRDEDGVRGDRRTFCLCRAKRDETRDETRTRRQMETSFEGIVRAMRSHHSIPLDTSTFLDQPPAFCFDPSKSFPFLSHVPLALFSSFPFGTRPPEI